MWRSSTNQGAGLARSDGLCSEMLRQMEVKRVTCSLTE